ncbi:hypothetical protein DCC79_13830, partial [bacterium]
DANPAANGIRTGAITLAVGTEPTTDGDTNANTNLTLDLAFGEDPRIGVSKTVADIVPLVGGGFNVTYGLIVRNYGNVKLNMVQVTDDLAATFADANSFDMVSVTSIDFAVNPGYTGAPPNTNLLLGSNMLDVGAQGSIKLRVRVVPGAIRGPYNNSATATAESTAGTPVADTSHDGVNPDPDGDDDPTNNNDPTPIDFPRPPTGVVLSDLAAEARPGGGTEVVWVTGSEVDVVGFNVLRADAADGVYVGINPALIPATGSASAGEHYRFADTDGTDDHFYKLEVVTTTGVPQTYGPVSIRRPWLPRGQRLFLPATLRQEAMRTAATLGGATAQGR